MIKTRKERKETEINIIIVKDGSNKMVEKKQQQ